MLRKSPMSAAIALALAAAAVLPAGCSSTGGTEPAAQGQPAPRAGTGEPVDNKTGTPLPGRPSMGY